MNQLNLFSVIDNKIGGRYSKFVLPFIAFPLLRKQNVVVEVRLSHADEFIEKNKQALAFMNERWPDKFLVAKIDTPHWNTLPCGSATRFIQKPKLEAKWTKICDVDIMHLDEGLFEHFESLERKYGEDKVYFALKRPELKKLSGTLCVKTRDFYTSAWEEHLNDYLQQIEREDKFRNKIPPFDQPHYYHTEYVNWDIVTPVHGEPFNAEGANEEIRPIQGIHISLNRPAYAPPWQPDRPDWEITDERKKVWRALRETDDYNEVAKFFDLEMIELLDQI